MITQQQAERIAAAVSALRPEWPIPSLVSFIGKHLTNRALLDVTVAFAYIAVDRDGAGNWKTQSPGRILGAGPWWCIGTTDPDGEARRERDERDRRSRMAGLEEARRDREACHVCDETGRLPSGLMCPHTDQAAINRRGAERARLALIALQTPTVTEEA